jgi:hypothetical protein
LLGLQTLNNYLLKTQQGTIMTLSKNTLAMTILTLSIGLSACTDTQKESAQKAETETKEMATQAKEKSVELYDKTKEGAAKLANSAADMAGDVKDKASEAYDATAKKASDAMDASKERAIGAMDASKQKAAELKTDAAGRLKEACIATKKKLGQDPEDC